MASAIKFDIFLVGGNDDILLVRQGYCEKCMTKKINLIRRWEANDDDVRELVRYRVRKIRIICECDNN